ncbi:putative membrane protein YpjA [Melghirimyces profundicolus]|uniref:Putative membrane protein YpjA n=1 Tax=Melghirimyces profundicolus TaxID=1242148 RepID=A0A2T6BV21_9BACL|nr:DUF1405 domain-containing protein [Melghirimyces profundicolus]PTX59925.1 putative membrane protein YpjA [Melghirimyces profundicolus]
MPIPWWWNRLTGELDRKRFLWLLLMANFLGSIYGFYWYKNQLAATPGWWKCFVPDSPTASAVFTVVLLLYVFRRRSPFWEAFGAVTLFKYGIWAVVMILAGALRSPDPFLESLTWTDWMLMGSHLGMAFEGILYSRFFTFGARELFLVGAWTLLNDAVDYGLDLHPWLPASLAGTEAVVAVFTVGMSLTSLLLFAALVLPDREERKREYPYWLGVRRKRNI